MKNIFLIGFMGSGKSTVAAVFEQRHQMQLIEMDQLLSEKEGMSIPEIFKNQGEEYFRNLETELLETLKVSKGQIVSCGGGVVLRDENINLMKENGVVVLLMATPKTILNRVKDSEDRPLLNGNMNEEYISEMLKQRKTRYSMAADIVVHTDGKNALEICNEIVEKMKNRRK